MRKYAGEGSELVTNCYRFKLSAAAGKMKERLGKEISWLQNVTD
jgi:hypothetical protein